MTGYSFAVWSAIILAEILVISVVLNIVWLRRRGQPKVSDVANALTLFIESIAAKAKAIKDTYRQIISDTASDVPTLLTYISTQERELEELLHSGLPELCIASQSTDSHPLQPIWNDIRDGHTLLNTITDTLFDKTQLFLDLMEKMKAQEKILHELTELSTTYQQELKNFTKEPQDQQMAQELLHRLTQNYQALQSKLEELTSSNRDILTKDSYYVTFSEQYRTFCETLQNLKIDNLRMSEKLRTQEPKLEWLRQEKTRMEEEIDRLKGLDEAHRAARRKATQLEEQLQRANEETQRLKSEISALTAEYLKLFERQSA
jgi:DNA repair exonuclease SbcCD ATPase subunit